MTTDLTPEQEAKIQELVMNSSWSEMDQNFLLGIVSILKKNCGDLQREKQELEKECATHVATIERMNQINQRIANKAMPF
jgi:phage host-nuclease inhibitor protein Gam